MKREILPENITVYKDDNNNVIMALQDIPIRAGDEDGFSCCDDDPDEISGYSTTVINYPS